MATVHRLPLSHGISDVPGFRVNGGAGDIRGKGDDRLDVSLIVSDRPATAAAVFTRNAFAAAPVILGREVLAGGGNVRAIFANSGNANACTGEGGMADARRMAAFAAEVVGCTPAEVFVCSTGRIGERLPLDRLEAGLVEAAADLGATAAHGHRAADAILTSDTHRKVVTVKVETPEGTFTVAGIAKGAGMIEPNMATMLAFVGTDVSSERKVLQASLAAAIGTTFNAITVDGDMSTNDTVIALANGASGIRAEGEILTLFNEALRRVCEGLADMIVGDGEKVTKVVELLISGAARVEDAEAVARAIGNSLLVKSSWFGNDPNWGRLLDAAGYAGVEIQPERVRLQYQAGKGSDAVSVFLDNEVVSANKPRWKAIVAQSRFTIRLDLGAGAESYRLLASDLTDGYVNYNKSE